MGRMSPQFPIFSSIKTCLLHANPASLARMLHTTAAAGMLKVYQAGPLQTERLGVVLQVALLRQGKASGRLVVLVQALTTPTLVAAAAADSQPAGPFVQGTDVPAVIQVSAYSHTSRPVLELVYGTSILTCGV